MSPQAFFDFGVNALKQPSPHIKGPTEYGQIFITHNFKFFGGSTANYFAASTSVNDTF